MNANQTLLVAPTFSSSFDSDLFVTHLDLGVFGVVNQPIIVCIVRYFLFVTLNVSSVPSNAITIAVYYNPSFGYCSYRT